MSKEKIKIASTPEGHSSGKPLTAVVEYCLERGARLRQKLTSAKHPFISTREGYPRCIVITEISFQEILDVFLFPDFIEIGNIENPYFWDKKFDATLSFSTPEKEVIREEKNNDVGKNY